MLDYQRQCCLRGKNICDKHQLICWQFTNPYHRSWIRIDLLPWVDHKTWRDLHWEKMGWSSPGFSGSEENCSFMNPDFHRFPEFQIHEISMKFDEIWWHHFTKASGDCWWLMDFYLRWPWFGHPSEGLRPWNFSNFVLENGPTSFLNNGLCFIGDRMKCIGSALGLT